MRDFVGSVGGVEGRGEGLSIVRRIDRKSDDGGQGLGRVLERNQNRKYNVEDKWISWSFVDFNKKEGGWPAFLSCRYREEEGK